MADLEDGLSLTLDEILTFDKVELPINEDIVAKLINVDGKIINDAPVLVATFEIQEGSHKNLTVEKLYWVGIAISSKGKPYSRGLASLKADAATFGGETKLPRNFTNPVDLKGLRLSYHKIFSGAKLYVRQTERFYEKDGERKRVLDLMLRPIKSGPVEVAAEQEVVY
jgi:hypothetical protein